MVFKTTENSRNFYLWVKTSYIKTGSRTKNLRSTPDIPEGSHGSHDSSKLSGVLLG